MSRVPELESPPLRAQAVTETPQTHSLSRTTACVAAIGLITTCASGVFWHHQGQKPLGGSVDQGQPASSSHPMITDPAPQRAVWLALVAPTHAAAMLEKTHLNGAQKHQILAAIKKRKVRVVLMPISQISAGPRQTILIRSAGITQRVDLTPQWQNVVLPLTDIGEVQVQALGKLPSGERAPARLPAARLQVSGLPGGGLQTAIATVNGTFLAPTLLTTRDHYVLKVVVQ